MKFSKITHFWGFLLAMLVSAGLNAQSIGLVGDFTSWGGSPDVAMSTTDNVNYTLSNYTFTASTGLKFRQDSNWGTNWGGTFPSGTGVSGGSNISVPAGTYNISFNLSTLAFSFNTTAPVLNIGIVGELTSWGGSSDIAMTSTDGITYSLLDYTFPAGELKFRQDNSWTNSWGAASFPTGTATSGGSNITVPAGRFDVSFNYNTLAYAFSTMSVSIIGDGAQGWGTDVNLTTTNGVNYTLSNVTLANGLVKFRKTGEWGTNWGSTSWPSGVASNGGDNIPTVAGIYNISFNRITGAFTFQDAAFSTATLSGTGTGSATPTEMASSDGTVYTLVDQTLVAGGVFFNANGNTVYADAAFPTGTAVGGATSGVPALAGHYNISFNSSTLAYSFTPTPITLIGDGAGGWSTDVPLTSADGGNTYTLSNYFMQTGYVKFRANSSWSTNWGSAAWPTGTGVQGGDNIPTTAGTYDITFNRNTGAYTFTAVATAFDNIGIIGAFNNWSASVPLVTPDGNIYTLTDYYFSGGEAKFRLNDAWDVSYGGSTFPSGDASTSAGNFTMAPGYYTVTFVNNTSPKTYSFTQTPISMIGSGAQGWTTDVAMNSTDGGITWTMDNYTLQSGGLKFRANNAWVLNWGGVFGASGTAVPNGGDFQTVAGSYNISFNRLTGAFAFSQNTYYADNDGDGFGDAASSMLAAVQPAGYVTDSTDCNDASAAVNPNGTEICNGLDDNCSGANDEGFAQNSYYIDADGDGYGTGTAVVACTSPGPGYVTNGLDCLDTDENVNPEGTEECENGVDDDCVDGDAVCSGPTDAADIIGIGQYGSGVQNAMSVNLTTGTDSPQNPGVGNDRWFTFTAGFNAVRIALTGSTGNDDNEIALYNAASLSSGPMIALATENDVHSGNTGLATDAGNETLLFDQLTVGQQYYVCIRNTNGTPGICSMRTSYLRGSAADIGAYTNYTNTYSSTCQNFKAAFRSGAVNYVVNKWSTNAISGTPAFTYQIPSGTVCQMGKLTPANLSGANQTVYVSVDAVYNLPDAFGNANTLTARGTTVASITMSPEAPVVVRSTDTCPVYKTVTGSIATNRSVCGTKNYTWEFTLTNSLPFNEEGALGASRILALSQVDGIANGQQYAVRVRSNHFDNVSNSGFSNSACVQTIGAAGMPTIEEGGAIAERSENGVTTSIYPNPNNGQSVNFAVSGMEGELKIRIVDATGRVVIANRYMVDGDMSTTIDFGQTLATGVYMVEMIQNGEMKTMRMVVNR